MCHIAWTTVFSSTRINITTPSVKSLAFEPLPCSKDFLCPTRRASSLPARQWVHQSNCLWISSLAQLSFRVSQGDIIKVSRAAVSPESWQGKNLLLSPHDYRHHSVPRRLLGWGPQFLAGYWLQATLSFLLSDFLHKAAHNMAVCILKERVS